MADENVFPQDWGTGLQEDVDWVDAGEFAHLNAHRNTRGYVDWGFEFTVDYTNNILTITDGKAYLHETQTQSNDHQDDGGPDAKILEDAVFAVQRDVSGDRSLNDGSVNYIYLAIDQTTNDTAEYYINTTATEPPEPYLLIGRVDTFNEVIYHDNRNPITTSRMTRVTGPTTIFD